jgi:hypothetical protein
VRAKLNFPLAISVITLVQCRGEKYFAFVFPKSMFSSMRPALTRGTLRGRHERWAQDAMDVTDPALLRKTTGSAADGEVVWS